MIRHLRAFYNKWFIIPFLVWAFIGAILLLLFDKRILFSTVNQHHNAFFDIVMNALTIMGNGSGIATVLVCMLVFRACRNWWYIFAAIMCNAIPALVVQFLKGVFNSPRPFEYFKSDSAWIHFDSRWGEMLYHHSFPSGHSAGVFSLCCFLSLILPVHRSGLGLFLFLFALLVCYTRMYLAAHFYADVYVGSMLGTTLTLLCFALVRYWSKGSFNIITRRNNSSTLI